MTNNFEIKIPKYLLKEGTPDIEKLDFVFSLMVYYWYSGKHLVISVQHLFDLGRFLDWDNPRLEEYITAACENNNANAGTPKQDLKEFDAPTLARQEEK